MFKIITSCVCIATLLYGSVTYDPLAKWLMDYKKQFEWVSASTVEVITGFEGVRYKAYKDSKGNWTIGVGHLIRRQEAHLLRTELSDEQVRGILHNDLKVCSEALETAVKVPVTRTQSDALHSLCHNIGPDRMVKSEVVYHLNRGEVFKAADAFMNWTNPGLKQRRKAERALFLAEI